MSSAHKTESYQTQVVPAAEIARHDYVFGQAGHPDQTLFDRASATARIGLWDCDLATNHIRWSSSVYDLFEFERGLPVTRAMSLDCYTPASRVEMETARQHAIDTCTEFAVDAEIITATGKRRWMRLTGAVESENGVATRIFGMKQDITDEKLMALRLRYLAESDVMTGLANRAQFQLRLDEIDAGRYTPGVLMLLDVDGFKQINDTYGHQAGDMCLKELAQRLSEGCGCADLIARIGGDEFAIMLGANISKVDTDACAQTVLDQVSRPIVRDGNDLSVTASLGIAHYSGGGAEDLFHRADVALYAAKAAGKNTAQTHEG